jgi:hypothetical protein
MKANVSWIPKSGSGRPYVGSVIVVDDGSADDTARRGGCRSDGPAAHPKSRQGGGDGDGSTTCDRSDVLFTLLDAVLRETASEGGKLIERLRDEADMTIATFPKTSRTKGGGMGLLFGWLVWESKDDGACNGGPVNPATPVSPECVRCRFTAR